MNKNQIKKVKFIPIIIHEAEFTDVYSLLDLHKNLPKYYTLKESRDYKHALLRAAVVLIVARIEFFVEELFEWATEKTFTNLSKDEIRQFYKNSSKKFNNPTSDNINKLFLEIGIYNVLDKIKSESSKTVLLKKTLDDLIIRRHEIAHGKIGGMLRADRKFSATCRQVKSWYKFSIKFMYQLENAVSTILKNNKMI